MSASHDLLGRKAKAATKSRIVTISGGAHGKYPSRGQTFINATKLLGHSDFSSTLDLAWSLNPGYRYQPNDDWRAVGTDLIEAMVEVGLSKHDARLLLVRILSREGAKMPARSRREIARLVRELDVPRQHQKPEGKSQKAGKGSADPRVEVVKKLRKS